MERDNPCQSGMHQDCLILLRALDYTTRGCSVPDCSPSLGEFLLPASPGRGFLRIKQCFSRDYVLQGGPIFQSCAQIKMEGFLPQRTLWSSRANTTERDTLILSN